MWIHFACTVNVPKGSQKTYWAKMRRGKGRKETRKEGKEGGKEEGRKVQKGGEEILE